MPRLNFFTRFVFRRAGWIAAGGLALAALASVYSTRLYLNLRTNIDELLPTTARSVIDLNRVSDRLVATDSMTVLVFSKNVEVGRRFTDDLARRLAQFPKSIVAGVEHHIRDELKFFGDRKALYVELKDLTRVRDYIRERVKYETLLYNPLNIFSQLDIPEPTLDFISLRNKYTQKAAAFTKFPDGYYATPDGTVRGILVYRTGKVSDIEGAFAVNRAVEEALRDVDPSAYDPGIEIRFTGNVRDVIEEHESLIADLALSTALVLALVSLSLLLYYRTWLGTLALMASLACGTLWTFGVAYFLVGYLNANSAFLGSIVMGNGINFGIIVLARYLEERRKLRGHVRALHAAMARTMTATLVAALAAGLAYGSLSLTSFRGFNQFGIIGLVGMILCWISAYTVLPAFVHVLNRAHDFLPHPREKESAPFATSLVWLVRTFPRAIWILSLVATAVSIILMVRNREPIIETDTNRMRDIKSMREGSGYYFRYLDKIFNRNVSPLVVLPERREDVPALVAALREQAKDPDPRNLISAIRSMRDFVPENQAEKIRVLREIQSTLNPRILLRLSESDRADVRDFLNPKVFRPFTEEDLPSPLRAKFTEADGRVGHLVLVELPLTDKIFDGDALIYFVSKLRQTVDRAAPGSPIAGIIPVTTDMIHAIQRDGPRATAVAFLAVVILAVVLFRNARTVFLVLYALLIGVTWLGGLIVFFDLKINFVNFIALPITFGIGVDYGVNIFQRYRTEKDVSILEILRYTGGAVGLASVTTIVGYGSLHVASNQAIYSFGMLSVLGEVACLTAALISLPAYLYWRELTSQKRARKHKGDSLSSPPRSETRDEKPGTGSPAGRMPGSVPVQGPEIRRGTGETPP